MKKLAAILSVVFILSATPLFAHSAAIDIGSLALGDDAYQWDHEDASPFKGTATVTVFNSGQDPWGDFHFEIYGVGTDATSVLFGDASTGGTDPVSSQTLDYWTVSNPVGGYSTIDLFFYSNPVAPGATATFEVYTDNTAESLSWFGMMVYPTPVPEPATMALLSMGALALLRRKK